MEVADPFPRPRPLVLCGDPGVPLLGPSGASAHLRGVVRALATLDGTPTRVAVLRRVDRRGAVDRVDAPVTEAPPRRWGWLPRRWREYGETLDARRLLARALREASPVSWVWERHSLMCDAGARSGLPLVLEVDAPLALERARWGRVLALERAERLERRVLTSADRVVAVSGWLARWAVEEAGCDPERVLHVPNGSLVDPGDREATRARLGLDGLVLGFVGSMRPWHGVDRIPALLDALPGATALVVGDGPAPVPDHPRLRWTGRVAPGRVPDLVAAMDVGLAPYRGDAPPWFCPLKILDYRAQGVPVVASDLGDAAHLLSGGGGEVVPADDDVAWIAAIRRQADASRVPRPRPWTAVVREALRDFGPAGLSFRS